MLCDYLKLNKTNMPLYVVGAEGMIYCRNKYPQISEIYKNNLQWIFDGLDGLDKNELTNIFKVGKQYTDIGKMDSFLKFFISQTCGLGRLVSKIQNKPELINDSFNEFENFGKNISEEAITELVFNLGESK